MNTHTIAQRAQALRHPCRYCGADIDAECVNRVGEPLKHQPAHLQRLRVAGIDPAAKPLPNLGCDEEPPF